MAGSFTITTNNPTRSFTITQSGESRSFSINTGVGPTGAAAPTTGIDPTAITGTAVTLSGNQTLSGDKVFGGNSTFSANVIFTDLADFGYTPTSLANHRIGLGYGALATGILKNTTLTGEPVIAVAGTDYLAPNGSGASLTALNGTQITSGTVPIARLYSSGTPDGTKFLRDDGTLATPAGTSNPNAVIIESSTTGGSAGDAATTVLDITLDSAETLLAFPSLPADPVNFSVVAKQDATGGRLVSWPGNVLWDGGTAPTLETLPFGVDVIDLLTYDGGATIYGKKRMTVPGVAVSWTTLDNFTRANATSLGTASGGGTWTQVYGAFHIASNQGVSVALQNDCVAILPSGKTAAWRAVLDWTSNPTANRSSIAIVFGYVNSTNYLIAALYDTSAASGSIDIYKRVAGTFTQIATSASSYTVGNNLDISAELSWSGTTITVSINGTLILSYSLTVGEQATFAAYRDKIGIRAFTASTEDAGSTKFRNLKITDL